MPDSPSTRQVWPVAGESYIGQYPTPSIKEFYVYRQIDVKHGAKLPEYGDVHPDDVNYPDFKVSLIAPSRERGDGWWTVVYASPRTDEEQENYNFQVVYPFGDTAFPDYIRTYIYPRDEYYGLNGKTATGPVALGTADPVYTSTVLIEPDKVLPGTDDPVLDNLFVKVVRYYATMPGPYIVREQTDDETKTGVVITSQRVVKPTIPQTNASSYGARGTVTRQVASNTFTQTKHGLTAGMCVRFSPDPQGGVAYETNYWTRTITESTFQIAATSNGTEVAIAPGSYTIVMGPGTDLDYQPKNTYYGTRVFTTLMAWDVIRRTEYRTSGYTFPALLPSAPTGQIAEAWNGHTVATLNWLDKRGAQTQNVSHKLVTTYGDIAILTPSALFFPLSKDLEYDGIFFNVRQHNVLMNALTGLDLSYTTGTQNAAWPYMTETLTASASGMTYTAYAAYVAENDWVVIASPVEQWKYPGIGRKTDISIKPR